MSRTITTAELHEFRRHAAAIRRLTGTPRPNGWSARSLKALAAHREACTQLTADLVAADMGDIAFALESEHNYLTRAKGYRADGDARWLNQRLAVVRRVIRKATSR